MSIQLSKFTPKSIVTDPEGNTLTGDQHTFTETPQVKSAVRFIPRATPPSDRYSLREGALYYDSDDKNFYYYDGTSWLPLIQPVSGTPIYAPSISNRITRFNGTGGAIKDSLVSLDDLGNIAGVNNLTTTGNFTAANVTVSTSLVTPIISSPGTGVSFNGKNITSVGAVTGTSGTFSGSVSTPSLTSPTTDVNVSGKNLTNAAQVNGTTASFTTSVSAPTVTASTSVSTPSITSANTAIAFNSKSLSGVNDVGAVTGTYSTSVAAPSYTGSTASFTTSVSTPSLTAPGTTINCNGKILSNVLNIVPAGQGFDLTNVELQNVKTVQTTNLGTNNGNLHVVADYIDFNNTRLDGMGDLSLYGNLGGTLRLAVWGPAGPDTLPRLSIDGSGTLIYTDGSSTIAGSRGYFGKGSQGSFTMGFTSGAGDGTLFVKTLTAPSSGMILQAQSGGAISTLGALSNDTSLSVPSITSVSTITGPSGGVTLKATGTGIAKVGGIQVSEVKDNTNFRSPALSKISSTASVTNVGTGVTFVTGNGMNWTIPAAYLDTNYEGFAFYMIGSTANNANTKSVGIGLNGSTAFVTTLDVSTANLWFLNGTILRGSSNTKLMFQWQKGHNSVVGYGVNEITVPVSGNWDSSAMVIQPIISAPTSAGDVTILSFKLVRL